MSVFIRYRILFFLLISLGYGYAFVDASAMSSGLINYLSSSWLVVFGYMSFVLTPFFFVQMGVNMPEIDQA